jgi:FkbM family methyltransferase
MRCAVLILRAEMGDNDRLRRSLAEAKAFGLGDFRDVRIVGHGAQGPGDLHATAQVARDGGFEWILAVSAAETVLPDIFVKTAPALRIHDAVWGAAVLGSPAAPGSPPAKPERITRLAAQSLPEFFHAALAWWIGPTHFVRPTAALGALHGAVTPAWYADYMLSLWRGARAYKTAQALTLFPVDLPAVAPANRGRLIEALEREPVFMEVSHDTHRLKLPYTGVNPVIEREQMRGQFFEPDELRFLAARLPRGLHIVDAGANTGNHTAFFAAAMKAARVTPIEPHPRAAAAIRQSVAANQLGNVDLSCLGMALGASHGRLRAILSSAGGLGATRFEPDPDGPIPVAPLDSLPLGPVDFLKIDVEGMEMEVLAGAENLIARHRPALYVEVLDGSITRFMAWADNHAYRIEKLFPDKTHCNYFLHPEHV